MPYYTSREAPAGGLTAGKTQVVLSQALQTHIKQPNASCYDKGNGIGLHRTPREEGFAMEVNTNNDCILYSSEARR